jgi:hypothetical protein
MRALASELAVRDPGHPPEAVLRLVCKRRRAGLGPFARWQSSSTGRATLNRSRATSTEMCAIQTGAALRTSLSTVADRDAPHGLHPPRNKQPPPTGLAAPSRRRQQSLAARATELNDLHALSHARRQADAPNSGFPVQYREREHERLELHQQRDGSCQDHIAGSLTPQGSAQDACTTRPPSRSSPDAVFPEAR